ncbi:aldo/keto reductase [Microcoleus sp. FACHB-1515]|uniref:aldo/keto reductase n=1 Tax=Cyanophyceae TaxID=3028117 RepID=UPI00168958B4|nr:aldo/keto reductase [Microcoleus sp. FACHB-1515]MBD2089360.1 aldo/keto reductase [Microcoleus sp. FACHB-1515]
MQTTTQSITLGNTNVSTAPLGIGTWAWGDKLFWNYGKDYDENQLRDAFNTAIEAGITLFDTAEIYGTGDSEKLIGRFMKERNQPVQIATKYFPFPWRFNGDAVADALSGSLKRLQLPSVALYQVHMPFDFFMGKKTLMNALADEVQQGRIQAIGVSNYTAEQMRYAHSVLSDRGVPLAVNQMPYSLLGRQIETNGVIETARDLNITILAYSPLAQGLLTGKYAPENEVRPSGARRLNPQFSREGLEKIQPIVALLREIGQKYDRTPAQVALNWLIAQGNVIPIPGAKNADQSRQNAGALGWLLTADEVDAIDRLTRKP